MKPVWIMLAATGVLTPAVITFTLSGSLRLSMAIAVGALLLEIPCAMLWVSSEQKALNRRLRRVAARLSGETPADDSSDNIGVFRQQRTKSWLLDRLERRFSMIDVRQTMPRAVGLGLVMALVVCAAAVFAQFGLAVAALLPVSWLAASWAVLALRDAGQRTEFVRLLPESVDQVVRLMQAGLPSAEAISVIAEEAQPPVNTVMRRIAEGFSAGLDLETVTRGTATHIRIPEFTLFTAAISLQRQTGGGISNALGNLSATLRARLEATSKAKSATAQTRLSLAVISLVPVAVLCVQNFTNPQAVETLFFTDSGLTLLRYGVGCIIVGLLVARGLAARIMR